MTTRQLVDADLLQQTINQRFSQTKVNIEPVQAGISTNVYKLIDDKGAIYYARISKSPDENFAPEYYVYKKLEMYGVKAPRVVFFEEKDEILQRSILVTTEIRGKPFNQESPNAMQVLFDAGAELAQINGVVVKKFGDFNDIPAEEKIYTKAYSSYGEYIHEFFKNSMEALKNKDILNLEGIKVIEKILSSSSEILESTNPFLSHGDFVTDHIYMDQDVLTGIIDFGDIKGLSRYHDLAHFQLYNEEFFEALLKGYKSVSKLPDNFSLILYFETLHVLLRKFGWEAEFNFQEARRDYLQNTLSSFLSRAK